MDNDRSTSSLSPDERDVLLKAFSQAMRAIYVEAKRQLGYDATYFLRMLSEQGPMRTAVQLVTSTSPSQGFSYLWERGRLDLTVEAVVVRPEFEPLFEDWVVRAATERIETYGD